MEICSPKERRMKHQRVRTIAAGLVLLAGFTCRACECRKIELTDSDFSAWRASADWTVIGDASLLVTNEKLLGVRPGTGVIVNGKAAKSQPLVSKDEFSDVRAHIEFVIPKGSNSGVFFQGQYELQIYDSWGVEKGDYAGIECGGIYQQWDEGRMPKGYDGISPKVNASRPAGQWQQFDVIFRGPRFDATGRKIANACFVKVWLNGTLIHDNVELSGPTRGSMHPDDRAAGPILLQGDHGPVAYRNIWIIPLDLDKMGLPNEFFAMDTATIDEHHRTAKEQVEMLKELGYAGIGYWERTPSKGPQGLVKMLSELSDAGLKPFPTYFTVSIDDPNDKSLPLIAESVRAMANRDAVIWLAMTSKSIGNSSQAGDERVVELVSGIADMAQQSGVRIALYPHDRYWLEHMDDAIRIAKKANRRNVGVTFNLYHWLRAEKGKNLDSLVAKAMPYLFAVTINGSSLEGSIETLDKGAFDVCAFLRTLKSAGYTGPIGLQGYGIPGDVYENLRRSMEAWKKCSQQLAIEDAGKL